MGLFLDSVEIEEVKQAVELGFLARSSFFLEMRGRE